jgi:hypothetical protein
MHRTRNAAYGQPYRGFESLPLRQKFGFIASSDWCAAPAARGLEAQRSPFDDSDGLRFLRRRERAKARGTAFESSSSLKKIMSSGNLCGHFTFDVLKQGEDGQMSVSEKFREFAAECQAMAKLARSPESKATWGRLAGRWVQCAELADHHASAASAAVREQNLRCQCSNVH